MTDESNQTEPAAADDNPADAPPPQAEPAQRTRWRDRAIGLRAALAVALATLILGGLGGAAIGVVASGDGDHDRHGPSEGRWPDGDGGPRGRPEMPQGGMPPAVPREDESAPGESVTPSAPAGSGTSS